MSDPRIEKLARVLVHYSIELQPGQQLRLWSHPAAQELALAVYTEAVKAGAHIFSTLALPGADEAFFRFASEAQLDYVSPVRKLVAETFDASISIGGEYNTRELSNIDAQRISRQSRAGAPVTKIFFDRAARNELRWCYTEFPTHAKAQEADMSLREYEEFVYGACLLHLDDPVAAWREEGLRQRALIAWLHGKDRVEIRGKDIDLSFSIKERTFKEADGKYNFPDGEIFTGPVEDSANGWVRFSYPALYEGREVTDVELWFENGKVVKESATKGQELLTSLLDMDAGARFLGEWGIGTNYGIQRFTKNMLFDEKIGGTIHLALGASYPETGGKNDSGLHWDMLVDMKESEVLVDGELFYQDGKPVV